VIVPLFSYKIANRNQISQSGIPALQLRCLRGVMLYCHRINNNSYCHHWINDALQMFDEMLNWALCMFLKKNAKLG
jgi:hypothetical protein